MENIADLREKTDVSFKIPVKEIDLKFIVGNLLNGLSAKQKLVLSSRFGISNGGSKTLESIGKNLNITRERVRQIEADAIKSLRKMREKDVADDITKVVRDIAKRHGGIIAGGSLKREVFERFLGKSAYSEEEGRLAEVLFLLSGLKKNKSNRELNDSWTNTEFDKKYFKALVEELERIFDSGKKILNTEEVLQKVNYGEFPRKFPQFAPEHAVSALEVWKKFGKNVFGDWGRAKWPLVSPRGVREKATLVLLKKKKPLHFREISKLIGEYGMSRRKVHPQTVHNELIREKRFVLVGRGTYALREWGYEEGTVKDVIISLLREAGGFINKEKLYQNVLRKRYVKKATIAVNLADRKLFEKSSSGYKLKAS